MKHRITTTDAEGNTLFIKIRLDDECKNGHSDFSITCDAYQKGQPTTDRYSLYGGCCHDEILKVRPDLKIFIDLHLSDAKGAPMYAVSNGYYFIKNKPQIAQKQIRATNEQYEILKGAEDKNHFHYLLHSLNIPAQWEAEAKEAIKLLESLTGETFTDTSTRYQYTPPTKEAIEEMEQRIKDGYYSTENKAARLSQKLADAKQKKITEVIEHRDKEVKKANDQANVYLALLEIDFPTDNFIYYNHTNEGAFNWKSCDKQITPEQLEELKAKIDYSKLPEGITFKISAK